MVELNRRDLAAVIDFGARIRTIREPDRFGQAILAPLRELVPADSITYNEIDLRRRRSFWAVDPPDALDATDPAAFVRYVGQHPIVSYSRRTGDGRARAISDFLEPGQFHRTDLYSTFFRPAQVEHQIAVTLSYAPSVIVGVALNRSTRDFKARDRAVLDLARVQLVAGYQDAQVAKDTAELLAAMDEALDDQRRGVLTIRPDGRVLAATPTAQRLLRSHLGIRLDAGQRLPHRLASLAEAAPARCRPLTIMGNGARLYLRLLASPQLDQRIVVVDERPAGDPPPLEAVGLTRRELDVLELLSAGRSNADIARLLRMSVRTVHKHLEHLYPKLGVHDRTAAATAWLVRRGIDGRLVPVDGPDGA
jgi:DNA-binding CsgD family transcriptional regulator